MRSFSLSPWIRGAQQEEKKRRREKGESMSYTALQPLLRNHQLSIKAWMTFTEVRTRKLKGNGSDLTKINDCSWGEPESQPTMGDAARVPALKRKIIMGKTPQMFLECWKRWRELGRGSSTFRHLQTFGPRTVVGSFVPSASDSGQDEVPSISIKPLLSLQQNLVRVQ